MQECSFCEEAMNGVSQMDDSLKSANIIRDLRKKGRKKFNTKKSVFDFIGINNLIVLLFVIGMLIFVAVLLMRLKSFLSGGDFIVCMARTYVVNQVKGPRSEVTR